MTTLADKIEQTLSIWWPNGVPREEFWKAASFMIVLQHPQRPQRAVPANGAAKIAKPAEPNPGERLPDPGTKLRILYDLIKAGEWTSRELAEQIQSRPKVVLDSLWRLKKYYGIQYRLLKQEAGPPKFHVEPIPNV